MNFRLNLIDKISEKSAALLYLASSETEREHYLSEINYLSSNLLSKSTHSEKNPQIIFARMYNKPFLFYIQDKKNFEIQNFKQTINTFIQSNDRKNYQVICLGKVDCDKLKESLEIESLTFLKVQ